MLVSNIFFLPVNGGWEFHPINLKIRTPVTIGGFVRSCGELFGKCICRFFEFVRVDGC